jgi:hypothetical protein
VRDEDVTKDEVRGGHGGQRAGLGVGSREVGTTPECVWGGSGLSRAKKQTQHERDRELGWRPA